MEKAPRTSPRASRAPKLAGCTHAGRFPHGRAASGQSHAAFPSQKGWGSGYPAPRPFRSGVSAVLAPRSGSERRCIPAEPPRFAWLIVALRSKYTRASSPGGGSSLARLVSRAPRPHRETGHSRCSRDSVHRLLAVRIAPRFALPSFAGRGNPSPHPTAAALRAANGFLQSLITTQTNERSTPSR